MWVRLSRRMEPFAWAHDWVAVSEEFDSLRKENAAAQVAPSAAAAAAPAAAATDAPSVNACL